MKNESNPIVKRQCERIRKHSKRITEAQKQLREVIKDAVKDHMNFNSLYL